MVAAGLVNPVAGRNFQADPELETFLPVARTVYHDLESATGKKFLHDLPVLRKWMDRKDREKFGKKRPDLSQWIAEVSDEGVTWKGGGWLDTKAFLTTARELLGEDVFRDKPAPGLAIRCTGARGLRAGEFPDPHRCAKGEILTLRLPGFPENRILNGGGWLIPVGDGLFRAGSTYDWDGLDSGPTREGREKVEKIVRFLTGRDDFEILAHESGIRPIIHRSEPQIRFSKDSGWMLNGLGSKGVIYAPLTARRLVERM